MDPYRCPPVTGPATRREKRRARISVAMERPGVVHLTKAIEIFWFPAITIALVITAFVACPPKEKHWIIECPGHEPWTSPQADAEDGRIYARDAENRRVILPADCQATEVFED